MQMYHSTWCLRPSCMGLDLRLVTLTIKASIGSLVYALSTLVLVLFFLSLIHSYHYYYNHYNNDYYYLTHQPLLYYYCFSI